MLVDNSLGSIDAADTPPRRFKPSLTAPEKAFWKDAFLACAQSTLLRHDGKRLVPNQDAGICADFADAAMNLYRSRVIWRKPIDSSQEVANV